MRALLNTLYVTTEGAYLARQREAVLVRLKKQTLLRVPVHNLEGIVCLGRVGCSPSLMGLCGQAGVAIVFLSPTGRFLARVQGPTSGNVLLRRQQYRAADEPEHAATIARHVVVGKLTNSRTCLRRGARDRPEGEPAAALTRAADRLSLILSDCEREQPLDVVRGHEGEAAAVYFGAFDHLITAEKPAFAYVKRSRRPPLDRINALLSFLYTLVTQDCVSACESVGLDPAVGFLHRDRPGRPGLALDLVEELRPFLADRLALSLVNRRQVQGGNFDLTESGAVTMKDKPRKEVIVAYQKRKQEELQHPYLREKVPVGLVPHIQALLLARHLRGDLEAYPPFLWR